MDEKPVTWLEVGDRFLWCDRVVEVAAIEASQSYCRRPGRYLSIVNPARRLHYYDDEYVMLPW